MSRPYEPNWAFVRQPSPRPLAPNSVHYRWLALGILLLTSYGCLIPLRFQAIPISDALLRFRQMPLLDLSILGARGDWVISIVQFAVLSYLAMAAFCVDRRWEYGIFAALIVVPACVALSVGLEFLQIYFPPRTISVNDLLVESLGSMAGVLLWLIAGQWLSDWVRRFWNVRGLPRLVAQCLPAYIAGLLILQLMPFDFTIGRHELAQKYHEGRIVLLPFQELSHGGPRLLVKALLNAAIFMPLGVLAALSPRFTRWNWKTVLQGGLAVTLMIESLQFLVYSRYGSTTDIITGTAAIYLSWRLTRKMLRFGVLKVFPVLRPLVSWFHQRPERGTILLFCLWLGPLLLINWQPFEFTMSPERFALADGYLTDEDTATFGWRRMSWAPLVDYYWASKYNALDLFVKKTLSFVPLGVLLGLTIRNANRPGAGLAVIAAALIVALGIEIGQYFIPARHPSTSDLLIECFGAWLGFVATRHICEVLWYNGSHSRNDAIGGAQPRR